jgi:hypothetical protein
LLKEMYTGMYKLKPSQNVEDAIASKPIFSDGFLFEALFVLGEHYAKLESLELTVAQRAKEHQELMHLVCADLIRYTTPAVESCIEDTLVSPSFNEGISQAYDKCRMRKSRHLPCRKPFWKPKQPYSDYAPSAKRKRLNYALAIAKNICVNYNTKGCKNSECKRKHVCSDCEDTHPLFECTK